MGALMQALEQTAIEKPECPLTFIGQYMLQQQERVYKPEPTAAEIAALMAIKQAEARKAEREAKIAAMNRVSSTPDIILHKIGPQIPPPPRMDTPHSVVSQMNPADETDGTGTFSDKFNVGKKIQQ